MSYTLKSKVTESKSQQNLLFFVCFLLLISTQLISAQPKKDKYIKASIGLGQSFPTDNLDIYGTGFFAQGEYVIGIKTWFGVRPYAGVLFTSPNDNQVPNYDGIIDVTTNAFLVGIKARIAAPIPYVAPYIESGIGASIGTFTNITPLNNFAKSGILAHIPVTLGLAVGKKHSLEIEFSYYFHNSIEQINGAFALGYTFPL